MLHSMDHLHGMLMLITHIDGYALPQPSLCAPLNIASGERYGAIVDTT